MCTTFMREIYGMLLRCFRFKTSSVTPDLSDDKRNNNGAEKQKHPLENGDGLAFDEAGGDDEPRFCLRCLRRNTITPLQEELFKSTTSCPSIILTSVRSSANEREVVEHSGFQQKPVLARQYGSPQTNGAINHHGYGPPPNGINGHQIYEHQADNHIIHQGLSSQMNSGNSHRKYGNHIDHSSRQYEYGQPMGIMPGPQVYEKKLSPRVAKHDSLETEKPKPDPAGEFGEEINEDVLDGTNENADYDEEELEIPSSPTQLPPPKEPPPPPSPTPQDDPEPTKEEFSADSLQNRFGDYDKPSSKQKMSRPKMKPGRLQKGVIKDGTKAELTTSPTLYPETLPPFDHPKEGLNKCLAQIENNDWEMTIQGMQSLIRLARHHPSLLQPHTHTIAVALSKHIRSLRSQVARASCQATSLLFGLLGRGLENDVEDLALSLFNRTADTNKFLRADCTHALECMVEHVSPTKSLPAILSKGAKHQNAVVRTVACRLLAALCARIGAERVFQLPKQVRDGVITTGAKLLIEGSLETRKHAKELFTVLSADPRLPAVMADIVPNNLMRNISKTLNKLQCNKS